MGREADTIHITAMFHTGANCAADWRIGKRGRGGAYHTYRQLALDEVLVAELTNVQADGASHQLRVGVLDSIVLHHRRLTHLFYV